MIEIKVNCKDIKKHQQEVSLALAELKKFMKKNGILNDLRKHEHYVAPSKKRRIKHQESIKMRKREEKKVEWHKNKGEF